MANVDAPFGLKPVRYLNGAPWNGQANPYVHAGGDTVALYLGSIVSLSGTANTAAVDHYPIGTLAVVKHAAAAGNTPPIVGVVVGVSPTIGTDVGGQNAPIYSPGSVTTDRVVWVVDDPMVIFQAQEDNDSGDIGVASAGLNIDLIATSGSSGETTGDTATGLSGWEIDSSSVVDTATGDLQLLNLSNIPGNVTGDYAIWDVRINLHQYNGATLGL